MRKRLMIFWNTARVFWHSLSMGVKAVILTLVLAGAVFLALSNDREVWLVLCGCLAVAGVLSAIVSYQIIFKDRR